MNCWLLGGYEVTLDKYKLKTLMGRLFRVQSEALAIAVATEWDAQHEFIKKPTMYLVSVVIWCLVVISYLRQNIPRPPKIVLHMILHFFVQ